MQAKYNFVVGPEASVVAVESSLERMTASHPPDYSHYPNYDHDRRREITQQNEQHQKIKLCKKKCQLSADSKQARLQSSNCFPDKGTQHQICPNKVIRLKYRSSSILLTPLLIINLLHSSWHTLCQQVIRLVRRSEQYTWRQPEGSQFDFCVNGSYDSKCSSLFHRHGLLPRLLPLLWARVRCQISFVKSDIISIIVLTLCLLSPVVTPAITSNNAVLPSSSSGM